MYKIISIFPGSDLAQSWIHPVSVVKQDAYIYKNIFKSLIESLLWEAIVHLHNQIIVGVNTLTLNRNCFVDQLWSIDSCFPV